MSVPTMITCPACGQRTDAGAPSCNGCAQPFPWSVQFERLQGELKERETNRIRATATLVQEAFEAAKSGKPVSLAAIKGFVTSWLFPRTVIVVGSIIGGIVLMAQTCILWNQTSLLQRQNEIVASEGLWELLWKAHYAPEPAIRLDAATDLAAKGHLLRGVILEGNAPPDGRFMRLRERPRFEDGEFDATAALVTVPARLTQAIEPQTFHAMAASVAGNIEQAEIRNLSVDFSSVSRLELRGLAFVQSLVNMSAPDRAAHMCTDCSFSSSEIRVEQGRATFESTAFRDTRLSSGLGEVFLRNCRFDALIGALTWGRDQIRNSTGYALVIDYHGWAGESAEPTFANTGVEHLLFVWSERGMADVEGFLTKTVHPSAQIGRYYFVKQEGQGASARLVILREPTVRANTWKGARRAKGR